MRSFAIASLLLSMNAGWAADTAWKPPTEEEYQAKLDKLSRPDRWEYRVSKDGVITRVTPTRATEGPDIEWVRNFRQRRIEAGDARGVHRVYYFNAEPGRPAGMAAKAPTVAQTKHGALPQQAAGEADKSPAEAPPSTQEEPEPPAEDAGKPPEDEKPPADADMPGTYEVYVGGKLVGTLELRAGGDLQDWSGNRGSTYRWLYKDQTLTLQLGSDLQRLSFKDGAFAGSILTVKKRKAAAREALIIAPTTTPEQPTVRPVNEGGTAVVLKEPEPEAPKTRPAAGSQATKTAQGTGGGEVAGGQGPVQKEDTDWPPKEVNAGPEDPKEIYPTEDEIEKIEQLCVESKNSDDRTKFDEAIALAGRIERRMCGGSSVSVEEWEKRFTEMNKLVEVFKRARGPVTLGVYRLPEALIEDFAKTEGHANIFAKLKWYQANAGKLRLSVSKMRVILYKYIENNPEKFKDAAAKKLFCVQIMKGGINDPGIKELSESFK